MLPTGKLQFRSRAVDCGIPDNSRMSDMPHLVIPYAAARASQPAPVHFFTPPALPNLERLLARLTPTEPDNGSEESLSPPHERAMARALGLGAPDGQIPLAALQAAALGLDAAAGSAWAFVTPCHWQMASAHVDMSDPDTLQLAEPESRALMAAMQPYFEEDGMALYYVAPTTWLARGDWFHGLATASLDRVAGRRVDDWMPRADQARGLRRLQNEMQMLLYTHAVNDARTRHGLAPVNSFWASGSGAWSAPVPTVALTTPRGLAEAARREDPAAWSAAWQQIDATDGAALLKALDQQRPVRLTLCGERNAHTFDSRPLGWRGSLGRWLKPVRVTSVLEAL